MMFDLSSCKGWVPILLLTALVITTIPAEAAVRVGNTLPEVQYSTLQGAPIRLPDSVRGKVAVIHFWSIGCSSCKEEMPAMESFYKRVRNKGVEIIAVNVGQGKKDVEEFVREAGISYPVLIDRERKSQQLLEVSGVPRTILLDRSGVIRFKIIGSTPPELLSKYVQSLIDR